MSQESIYQAELKKYHFNENGLHYKERLVAYCNPILERKVVYHDVAARKDTVLYYIRAELLDGSWGKSMEVSSFSNLSCFELWQCPDIDGTQKYIKRKLELEAAEMETEEQILCDSGLQNYEGSWIYVLGDKVLCSEDLKSRITMRIPHFYPEIVKMKKDVVIQQAKKIMGLMPGVTEIIFYYALQAVVKPLLHEWGINTNYSLAVIGASGHLKTTLVTKICLWLSEKEKQRESFSSSLRTKRIFEKMNDFSGMNYLIDDFHAYESTQDIMRQNKRLDDIVREVENNPRCANVVITGEYLQGIFSCIDRTFMVNIPKMQNDTLGEIKEKLAEISENEVAVIAFVFLQNLLSNLSEVKDMCLSFYEKERLDLNIEIDATTRTYRHTIFLFLTEFLFRKYLCDGSEEISCRKELKSAIEKQYKIQQRELKKYRYLEGQDYIGDVYNMLQSRGKYLKCITNGRNYKDFVQSYLQCSSDVFITREALRYGMSQYYQRIISVDTIIKKLVEEGIIDRGTDTFTKKIANKRHYKIHTPMMRLYLECRELEQVD